MVLFGLKGTGIAFFSMYVAYWIGIYLIVRRLSGFRWSAANKQLALLFVPLVAAVFISWNIFHPLAPVITVIVCAAVTIMAGIYSLKTLCALVPLERLPAVAQKMIWFFRLAPPPTKP